MKNVVWTKCPDSHEDRELKLDMNRPTLTSGVPRFRYMRKRWKYCCRWRPCSDTSFRSRVNTALRMWSLRVALGSAGWLTERHKPPLRGVFKLQLMH